MEPKGINEKRSRNRHEQIHPQSIRRLRMSRYQRQKWTKFVFKNIVAILQHMSTTVHSAAANPNAAATTTPITTAWFAGVVGGTPEEGAALGAADVLDADNIDDADALAAVTSELMMLASPRMMLR